MKKIAQNVLDAVGNTPLIRLDNYSDSQRRVFAKIEGSNPGGSMKDRTASLIVSELLLEGKIGPGGTIIESSSGNMAIGLAQACLFHGLHLMVVVDENLNPHARKLLQVYGATLITVFEPHPQGGLLAARLEKVQELLKTVPNSVWSDQYSNPNNPKAYDATMKEIMQTLDNEVDYLFVATSTCGSLMGCAEFIGAHGLKTKLVAVDAVGSILFHGAEKKRRIPGHGSGMPSNFLDIEKVFDVVQVTDAECVQGCRNLLKYEAVLAGGSSGGIVTAYSKYKELLPKNAVSVLLFADRGERYLDTIYNDNWVAQHIEGYDLMMESPNYTLGEKNNLISIDACV